MNLALGGELISKTISEPDALAAEGSNVPISLPVGLTRADAATQIRMNEAYGKLPLYFEANRGQVDPQVKFLSRGGGYTVFLTTNEVVLVLTKSRKTMARGELEPLEVHAGTRAVLRMRFVDSNLQPLVTGREELPGKANYFMSNDPKKWRTSVPTYAQVHYRDVYPGIDVIYYGDQRQVEYDFAVTPGADPNRIVLEFQGADKMEVDARGDLVLHTLGGPIRQRKPIIYQEIDGVRREIPGSYALKGAHHVGFEVAAYDARWPLVIDPVLSYSSYLGGSGEDGGGGIAVDADGNAYMTIQTGSTDFPTTPGAYQSVGSIFGSNVITKLNSTASALVYATYLGSNGFGPGSGITVDTTGNAYVVGTSCSSDFPTTPGAFQTTFGGVCDVFITKLNPTGSSLVYSTFLGGSKADFVGLIAADAAGNAYISGTTCSSDFPTTPGAFQTTKISDISCSAFITKLNPTGSGAVYSSYLNGPSGSSGTGIAVDVSGNAYVTGSAGSDFPTTAGAFQTTSTSGAAFIAKLNPTGSGLIYSTLLGGSGGAGAGGIAVDGSGNAYVTGTAGSDFPTTTGAFQTTLGGGSELLSSVVD